MCEWTHSSSFQVLRLKSYPLWQLWINCAVVFCPRLYHRCPRHDRVQNFCHTCYSLFLSQEQTAVSSAPESNVFVVFYRYCACLRLAGIRHNRRAPNSAQNWYCFYSYLLFMVYLKTLTFTRITSKVRIFREWRIGSEEKGNHLNLISRRISEFARMSEENHKNSQHNRYFFRDSIRFLSEIVRSVTAWSSVLGITFYHTHSTISFTYEECNSRLNARKCFW